MGHSSGPRADGARHASLSIEANGTNTELVLEAESYRLGRDAGNQISCPEVAGLSREHLIIERQGTEWLVRDLGSRNGTMVNGERISAPRVLRSGDRITASHVNLMYTEEGSSVLFTEDEQTATGITISESIQDLVSDESTGASGHMQALITVGRELSTHLPLDQLFELILNLSIEAAGAARGALMTLEGGELQVRSVKGRGLRISSHVRDMVIREKRSLLVRDAMSDAALKAHASIVLSQIRSMMAVPLQNEDRVIGLIYLDSSHVVKEFTKQDLSLLTVMANIAAVRIENARLAEVEQVERLRAGELEHAATIQRSMLPGQFPPFPDRRDFELHASMVPAKEVGGDMFDFFLLDQERVALVVGDVSGKGVPAALFMAIARTLLRASAPREAEPGLCLKYMNDALNQQHSSGLFITFFYGILNTRTGELRYANAGHNPPYAFTSAGALRPLSEISGPILGVFEDLQYPTHTVHLAPGEGVFIFTDGVTEACNKAAEFYGESRLEAYLAANASKPVDELLKGLQASVEGFEVGAPRADDITMLAVRRLST
jgi:serine phosphatase RsbU (regulator of sigma subunit)/pSer/pThr/pTyr-binding forkhead associated (FHA) protein